MENRFCALKLDMMKAYDGPEWPYLKAVMLKLGISPRFTDTVMRCVSSVSISVHFNGGSLDAFTPSQVVQQGDPISPYLFLLAAEGLSCILKAQGDRVRGISVAATAPAVNHLLFADDSLLFFEATDGSATKVRDILKGTVMHQVSKLMWTNLFISAKVLLSHSMQVLKIFLKSRMSLCQINIWDSHLMWAERKKVVLNISRIEFGKGSRGRWRNACRQEGKRCSLNQLPNQFRHTQWLASNCHLDYANILMG